MILVKADKNSEAGVTPSEQLLSEMGKFNEELAKAGVLLAAEGLHPSSKGARVRFDGAKRTVVNGPFPETKDLIAGFCCGRCNQRKKPSSGSSAVPIPITTGVKSRFVRCSRRRISGLSLRPSSGSKRSACARRWPRRNSRSAPL